jgi:hypothetical protein
MRPAPSDARPHAGPFATPDQGIGANAIVVGVGTDPLITHGS